ncbi:hypothetical protein ACG95P_20275 [Acinetobacter guillouiae]|uniref:hypothetical protein n=1 Tax=Acinetobacter guillouiae TaxID=106649 RepID=UPI003AF715F7
MSEVFKAGVQYDDYRGSVACDDNDLTTLKSELRKFFGLDKSATIVGIKVNANYEIRTSDIVNFSIIILTPENDDYDEKIISNLEVNVRKFSKEISIQDFFKLFKRFQLTLSSKGEFEKANYTVI